MSLTIGSLCSGYGGLDMAVESFFGARTAWFSEFDPAPSKVLAHHWPDVLNLGDMTRIDWATVEPVDIIAGGTPCQDLSGAGKRAGMTEGTRSNLWVQMREAVAVIRPKYVVWENVRGAYSAYAVSEVESETGLLGGYGADRPALRALGRVLGDLSDLGYDSQWVGVRASDVGAPHGRFRVFVLAHDSDSERLGWPEGCKEPGSGAQFADYVGGLGAGGVGGETCDEGITVADSGCDESERWGRPNPVGGTPSTSQSNGEERQRVRNTISNSGTTLTDTDHTGCSEQRGAVTVQQEHAPIEHDRSNPAGYVGGARYIQEGGLNAIPAQGRPDEVVRELRTAVLSSQVWDASRGSFSVPDASELLADMREQQGRGSEEHEPLAGTSAHGESMRGVRDNPRSARSPYRSNPGEQSPLQSDDALRESPSETPLARGSREACSCDAIAWGPYQLAIHRWEGVVGRAAPAPTLPDGRDNAHRLSARFVEFLMGLDRGHVTDPAIGLTRNQQLKALGNGVVPQQAELALNYLSGRVAA